MGSHRRQSSCPERFDEWVSLCRDLLCSSSLYRDF